MTTTKPFAPSITFLNWSGDVTITWDDQNRDAIEALVAEKMKQGYSFFILKPRILSFLGDKKVQLESSEQVRKAKALVVPDATAEQFMRAVRDQDVAKALEKGSAVPAKAPRVHELGHRAKSAAEVVNHQTMAIRPIVGG